jgi:ElaB/YqjD/DUF883 family membrane-anchored ribosome-binding protein
MTHTTNETESQMAAMQEEIERLKRLLAEAHALLCQYGSIGSEMELAKSQTEDHFNDVRKALKEPTHD